MYILNIHFNMTNESEFLEVPPMFGTARRNVLLELMQVSKFLQKVIMASTTHKNIVDEMIKMMVPKDNGASTSQPAEEDNSRTIEDNDNNNEDVSSGSEVYLIYDLIYA